MSWRKYRSAQIYKESQLRPEICHLSNVSTIDRICREIKSLQNLAGLKRLVFYFSPD